MEASPDCALAAAWSHVSVLLPTPNPPEPQPHTHTHLAGAYQGRGRGNAFLNDLCDADVLVHVVDVSGTTDREGAAVPEGEGADPCDDIR